MGLVNERELMPKLDHLYDARPRQLVPRLPLAPLARFVGAHYLPTIKHGSQWGIDWIEASPPRAVGEALGGSSQVRAAVRWAKRGLSLESAERACDRLGCHPFDVWGPLYYEAVDA